MSEVFKTPYVRLAWPKLTEKEAETKDNGKKKYSCSIYIPKNELAYETLKSDGRETALTPMIPNLLKDCEAFVKQMKDKVKALDAKSAAKIFKDGDKKADDKKAELELEKPGEDIPAYVDATRNFWILSVNSEYQPKFFGPRASEGVKDDAWAEENLYAGVWVRLDVRSPYSWSFKGRKGVSIGMGGTIQKWQDDAAYGGGSESTVEDAVELVPTLSDEDTID